MSSRGMMFARSQKTGNMTTKAVLLVLGELVDDTGITFRDQAFIADVLECSRATVNRAMKALEEAGLIAREERYEDDTHRRKADVIHLRLESKSHVTESYIDPPEPCNSQSKSHVTESYSLKDNLTTKHSGTASDTVREGDAEASPGTLDLGLKLSTTETLNTEFEQWYAVYPKEAGRALARRAFTAARKKTSLKVLIEKAGVYAKIHSQEDPRFLMRADKWLMGECWDDAELNQYANRVIKEAQFWKKGVH